MVALASGGAVYAQDASNAVFAGTVTGQNGQPLQGVRVQLASPSLLMPRDGITDARGRFRINLLPNGEYSATYTLNGYRTRRLTLRLIAGQTGNGSARLAPIDVEEATVEVVGQVAQVDKSDTIVQTTFNSDFLEKITGRGLNSLGQLAPGISTSSLTTSGNLRIRGGSGHSTKTLMDGANITNVFDGYVIGSFTVDDLVESVALYLSPVNARYGNTDGGLTSIVTSRGSNTFKGSLRVSIGRNGGWGTGSTYSSVRRDGTSTLNSYSGNDVLTKNFQVAIQGPLWKERVTFAYGARLTPTTQTSFVMETTHLGGAIWTDAGGGNYGQPWDRVGTFYENRDPNSLGYGDVIRLPELPELWQTPRQRATRTNRSRHNSFTIFAQINPQHQVEWKYNEDNSLVVNGFANQNQQVMTVGEPWNKYGSNNYNWNVSYKGIIGSSGVLDVNYGRNNASVFYGDDTAPAPIFLWTIPSRIPDPALGGSGANDFASYHMNGYLTAGAGSNLEPGAPGNSRTGWRQIRSEGLDSDRMSGGGTNTLSANYQHLLNTNLGTHMFDVGLQMQKFDYASIAAGSPLRFHAPGQISWNLKQSDIWNKYGNTSAPPSAYAGKYIVFNTTTAMLSDISPYDVARYHIIDRRVMDINTNTLAPQFGNVASNSYSVVPFLNERFGDDPGDYFSDMNSYYINDLWTINNNHSVQVGLRVDSVHAWDGAREFLKYSQPTFRFEYKWDLHGDQSRLLNIIAAQYHSLQPIGTFRPLVTTHTNHYHAKLWDKGGPVPYLVGHDEIINTNNYGYTAATVYRATNHRVDPNWKAPISTEFSVGMRRNFEGGGNWKLSLVLRSFENDYDFFFDPGGETFSTPNAMGIPQLNQYRILRNTDKSYDKNYTGIEFEWFYPFTKRFTFMGSYTYSRLMSNWPGTVDGPTGGHEYYTAPGLNFDWWRDLRVAELGIGIPGATGRSAWAPVRAQNSEHYFKFSLLYDFSSGKVDSSLGLMGNYTSASIGSDSYTYNIGYPNTYYPEFLLYPAGGGVANTTGTAGFSNTVGIPLNTLVSGYDTWGYNLKYTLSVPLVGKMVWIAWLTIDNPFNARYIQGGFSVGGAGTTLVPVAIPGAPSGSPTTVNPTNVYRHASQANTVWRSDGDLNGNYATSGMGGRTFSLATGLRF
jgi:hypothetical protein